MDHLAWLAAMILDAAVKATILLVLAWTGGLLFKHRSAATRYMLRAFVLASLLLLPFSGLLPAWHVRAIPEFVFDTPVTFSLAPSDSGQSPSGIFAKDSRLSLAPAQSAVHRQAAAAPALAAGLQTKQRALVPIRSRVLPGPASHSTLVSSRPTYVVSTEFAQKPGLKTKLKIDWLAALATAWLLGAGFFALRWTVSVARLWRLSARATVVSDREWNVRVHAVAQSLELRRDIGLLESSETDVPLAVGIVHPQVILPPDYAEWSEVRRNAILYHEIAHIKRLDALTYALAQAAAVLYWFHPLAWLMVRSMRADRERACDDQVLAAGTKASDYAHELLDIVSGLRQPALAAALAMARRSQLEGRVLAVLNPRLRRGPVSRGASFAVGALVLAVVVPIAGLHPAQQKDAKPGPSQAPAATVAPAASVEHEMEKLRNELAAIDSATSSMKADGMASQVAQLRANLAALEAESAPSVLISPNGSQLAELRAKIAALEAQDSATPLLDANSSQIEALNAKLADLKAQLDLAGGRLAALQAPEAPSGLKPPDPAGAPEAPEMSEPPDPAGAPQGFPAPSVPAVPGVPAVPSVPSVPSVPAVPAVPGDSLSICGNKAKLHNMSMESHDGHKRWTATWSGDDCSVDLHAEGEIQFNADATDIQSISSGGYFEVNVREDATLRQVRATPSGNGVQYVLKINGKEQPFDADAKAWFSSFLLSLERATGFAADARVAKLLAKGGPTAVLDEINNLQGDYVRGIYFRKLLDQPNLPAPAVVRIINQAGQQVSSDYELARILMEVSKQYELPDETSRAAFLNAAGKLHSDYEHARVLIELLKRPNISRDNVNMALNSAASINSDYEKSRILLSLIDQKAFDQTSLAAYLKMVASINSDYEKSRDLLVPMQRYTLAIDQINLILDAAAKMGSDYEKSRLLTGLVQKGKFDEGQMSSYLKVVNSMTSDYERARCLSALMERNKLSDASLAKVLENAARIKSDYEKSRVLQQIAHGYQLQGVLRESYIKAAESIGNEYERDRALAAVVRRASL